MKKLLFFLLYLFTLPMIYSQNPEIMTYQAVIRAKNSQLYANSLIKIKMHILQGSEDGPEVYYELHEAKTNANGLINLEIGTGKNRSTDLKNIDWNNGPFFLKTESNLFGDENFELVSLSKFTSVPFAFVANGLSDDAEVSLNNISGDGAKKGQILLYDGKRWRPENLPNFSTHGNVAIALAADPYWKTNGNAGTSPGTNFIGTTDDVNLIFKRNNIFSGILKSNATSFGVEAFNASSSAGGNSAFGNFALNKNTSGFSNTAIGNNALRFNSNGAENTAIGSEALLSNTTGLDNTAIGTVAMNYNTIGKYNTAMGAYSLLQNTSGSYNTAIGMHSMGANTVGNYNVANGLYSLYKGNNFCVAIGNYSQTNNAGFQNCSLGNYAMHTGGGLDNCAFGDHSLYFNQGIYNSAFGSGSLYSVVEGRDNCAFGYNSLRNLTGTVNNTSSNCAFGSGSSEKLIDGTSNVAIGFQSLKLSLHGNLNTVVGANAGYNVQGYANTSIGHESMYYTTYGNYMTALGSGSNLLDNSDWSSALGYNALANASNKVVIGSNNPTIEIGGYAPWSNLSDGRFKENVKSNVPGLDFINKLNPVTYNVNVDKLQHHITSSMPDSIAKRYYPSKEEIAVSKLKTQTGFIAQEVEKAAKEIDYAFDGVNAPKNKNDNYSIAYSQFVPSLVKAIQEQQALILSQEKKIEELNNSLKVLNQLKADLKEMKDYLNTIKP